MYDIARGIFSTLLNAQHTHSSYIASLFWEDEARNKRKDGAQNQRDGAASLNHRPLSPSLAALSLAADVQKFVLIGCNRIEQRFDLRPKLAGVHAHPKNVSHRLLACRVEMLHCRLTHVGR